MSHVTADALAQTAHEALSARNIHFGLRRCADLAVAPFGEVQMVTAVKANLFTRLKSVVAVQADSRFTQERLLTLGARLKDPLATPRMQGRARHTLLDAVKAAIHPVRLGETFEEFEAAVAACARGRAQAQAAKKFKVTPGEVQVQAESPALVPLQEGQTQRDACLKFLCTPHRWAAEDLLSSPDTARFEESVTVRVERLGRDAVCASFVEEQVPEGWTPVTAVTLAGGSWAGHAPLHLLEAAGLNQKEILSLKVHPLWLGGMDPTSDLAQRGSPAFFGADHLQRIRDIGQALTRTGAAVQQFVSACHYGDNPDSEATRKLRLAYPEGVVLVTRQDVQRDQQDRQRWLDERRGPAH